MLRPLHGFALLSLGIAAACATVPPAITGDPTVSVTARAETPPVGTANADAADDPAIWRNAADPAASLIVGTDKKGGLYVYNLKGEQVSFLAAPGLNNVDLIQTGASIWIVASDRSDLATAHLSITLFHPWKLEFDATQRVPVGPGEGYGLCLGMLASDGSFTAFSAPKNGVIYQTRISEGHHGDAIAESSVLASVPSQPEGCVVDDRTGTLYVGEEAAGIWAIDIATGSKEIVAPVGTGMLVADVEGLAIAPEGKDGGYLVASSQGDNAYAVYRLPGMEPLGRFRIAAGAFGATEETDGIALDPRDFGPDFPGGLFIAQDGINPPRAQNFKYVRWDDVLAALEGGR
ncbi:phytase [Erythrobacter donghaensis]|uniref:phytase n=1 Tax=Erythrobacter donghaensis TaxID=267135 RepID=UPI000A36D604|nr:phytase [Erythrobacter donghaensis]